MMNLFSVCDLLDWPWLLLWWLLPFLLGLLLGWLIWGSYRRKWESCQKENADLRRRIADLETQLANCKKRGTALDNDIHLLKAEIRELKASSANEASIVPIATVPKSKTATSSSKSESSVYAVLQSDQLQVVEGIGPKMESVLKDNDIKTWGDLSSSSPEGLRKILDSYGSKYKIIDPATWPEQAGMANEGDWEGLIARQKQLSGGNLEVSQATDSKVEKMLIRMGVLKKFKQDDLKAIEGIGPKIEGLLHDDNITTWKQLSEADVQTLKDILTKAGDRYKLADPTTWPKQAEYAHNGQWKELQEYQDFLQGGRE